MFERNSFFISFLFIHVFIRKNIDNWRDFIFDSLFVFSCCALLSIQRRIPRSILGKGNSKKIELSTFFCFSIILPKIGLKISFYNFFFAFEEKIFSFPSQDPPLFISRIYLAAFDVWSLQFHSFVISNFVFQWFMRIRETLFWFVEGESWCWYPVVSDSHFILERGFGANILRLF